MSLVHLNIATFIFNSSKQSLHILVSKFSDISFSLCYFTKFTFHFSSNFIWWHATWNI